MELEDAILPRDFSDLVDMINATEETLGKIKMIALTAHGRPQKWLDALDEIFKICCEHEEK